MSYGLVSAFPQGLEQIQKQSYYSVIFFTYISAPWYFQLQIVLSWDYQKLSDFEPLESWSFDLKKKKITLATEVNTS